MRAGTVVIVLLLLASVPPEPAFAQGTPVVIHGAGSSSCGKYIEVYDAYRPFIDGAVGSSLGWQATANYWQYEEWIEGYLYGLDTRVYSARRVRDWDRAGMRVWIYNYCQKHPLDFVANAALAFFKELGGKLD